MDLMTQLSQIAPQAPASGQSKSPGKSGEDTAASEAAGMPFAGLLEKAQTTPPGTEAEAQAAEAKPEAATGQGQTQATEAVTAASGETANTAGGPVAAQISEGPLLPNEPLVVALSTAQTQPAKAIQAQPIAAAGETLQTEGLLGEPEAEKTLRLQGLRSLEIKPTGGTYEAPSTLNTNVNKAAQTAVQHVDSAALTEPGQGPETPGSAPKVPLTGLEPATQVAGQVLTKEALQPKAVPATAAPGQDMPTEAPALQESPPGSPGAAPAAPEMATQTESPKAATSETPATQAAPAPETVAAPVPQEGAVEAVATEAQEGAVKSVAPEAQVAVATPTAPSTHSPASEMKALPVDDLTMDVSDEDDGPLRNFEIGKAGQRTVRTHSQAASIRSQVLSQAAGKLEEIPGGQKMTLHLNPEKLGQVELHFEARDNRLEIIMTASGPEAEKALQEGAKDLADKMTDRQGRWQVVDIRVETRQQDTDKPSTTDEKKDRQNRDGRRDGQQRNQNPDQGDARQWARDHQGG